MCQGVCGGLCIKKKGDREEEGVDFCVIFLLYDFCVIL